jgi:sugar phosphate isomerase/epimerase
MACLKLGMKCSVKDLDIIMALKPAFLETYIGAWDYIELGLEGLVERFSKARIPIVVHVPEYQGYLFLDIASEDQNIREASLNAVRCYIELADRLGSPHIVLHPGGISEGKLDTDYAIVRLRNSLEELSYDKFYLENMPWFYFRARDVKGMTKRVHSNIMIDVDEYYEVKDLIAGMTLDICHGFLSTKKGSMKNLLSLFDMFPDMPRYLHISDALPPDGEGLQLGKGAIELGPVLDRIKERGTDWWGIPEIMDGHKDGGAGFVEATRYLKERGL